MKLVKLLAFLGVLAALIVAVVQFMDDSGETDVADAPSKVVPVVEETLKQHQGEESPMVQAFADAVEDAKKS